jgi:predicted dehydrogenase
MKKKGEIGICLIGCGRAGMIHARNFINKVQSTKMVAVVDVQEAAAKAAADELGLSKWSLDYHDYLSDKEVDAVIVVAPTDLHCAITKACAAHGKHVFCEKPMAMNREECQEMIGACEAAGVKLQIGFMRRHDRGFVEAKRLLDAGAIGDLVLVKSHTRGPSKPQAWMFDLKKSNGILAEVNSHDIDAVRWFSGSDFSSLYAIGANYRNPEVKTDYPDYYDSVVMSGTLKNGVQFVIDGAAYVQYGYDSHVELVGTRGLLHVGGHRSDSVELTVPEEGTRASFVKSWTTLFMEAYLNEDIAFARAILEDTDPVVTGYDGLMAVAVVQAGNESIGGAGIVRL